MPTGKWNPSLALDLNHDFQRKVFYFTPAFGRRYLADGGRRILEHYLRPGAAFLDIGANLGFFSFSAAQMVGPGGSVHAFEPEPDAFASLAESAHLPGHDMVRCHPVALSDMPRDNMTFHLSRTGNAHSLLAEAPGRENRYRTTMSVEVESLDHLIATGRMRIDRVGLVKIDVEGVEASVVAGMLTALRDWRLPSLFIEVRGPLGSTRAPDTFRQVHSILEPLGYQAYRVDREGRTLAVKVADVQMWANILFATSRPTL